MTAVSKLFLKKMHLYFKISSFPLNVMVAHYLPKLFHERKRANRPKYGLWILRKNDSSTQKNAPQNYQ